MDFFCVKISPVFYSDTICTINYLLSLIFNIYQHLIFSHALIFNGHDFTRLSCDWRGSKSGLKTQMISNCRENLKELVSTWTKN